VQRVGVVVVVVVRVMSGTARGTATRRTAALGYQPAQVVLPARNTQHTRAVRNGTSRRRQLGIGTIRHRVVLDRVLYG